VADRYFATPKRKFIIADTPGHVQNTRNMVTGASTADLGLVLVDAPGRAHRAVPPARGHPVAAPGAAPGARGERDGPRRLRPGHVDRIHEEFNSFATIPDLEVIPISALKGDNVVNRSENMPSTSTHQNYSRSPTSPRHHLPCRLVRSSRIRVALCSRGPLKSSS
jgi:Elongation factor Tu GTP binding domain